MFKKEFTVTETESGQRIDALCAHKFPVISRSKWTKRGQFECEGRIKSAKSKVKLGEQWLVSCEIEATNHDLLPWDYRLEVLEETDHWVVINKPYGIAVHPSASDPSQTTIVNALLHHYGANLSENFDLIETKKVPRPGLVHRLDKTTSGVLLVAKNNSTHQFFQSHWADYEKTYKAVVTGRPPQKGKIESGIIRDPYDRKKMMASDTEKSKWAVTEFERIEQHDNHAVLQVKILTGRTHQIRVHLSSIGFPVVGDVLYGGTPSDRVKLHAQALKFYDEHQKTYEVKVESDF